MQKSKIINSGYNNHRTRGSETMPVAARRSVSIDQFVHENINSWRAALLQQRKIEMDYTTALNIFAEFAIRILQQPLSEQHQNFWNEVTKKYSEYPELHGAAIQDLWQEYEQFMKWKQQQEPKQQPKIELAET